MEIFTTGGKGGVIPISRLFKTFVMMYNENTDLLGNCLDRWRDESEA